MMLGYFLQSPLATMATMATTHSSFMQKVFVTKGLKENYL
jgi:hypothetical protein